MGLVGGGDLRDEEGTLLGVVHMGILWGGAFLSLRLLLSQLELEQLLLLVEHSSLDN